MISGVYSHNFNPVEKDSLQIALTGYLHMDYDPINISKLLFTNYYINNKIERVLSMRYFTNAITIIIIFLNIISCNDNKPKKKSIDLEKAIIGEWILSGFMCDKSGKCKKTIESGKTGITLTTDGRFFETAQKPLKYRIAGRDVIIEPDERYLKGGLSFTVVQIKEDELLLLWSYNERDQIYTKYKKNK